MGGREGKRNEGGGWGWVDGWIERHVKRREGGLVCLVSAAAGHLDNTLTMAIGYYEHYSNCGDVKVPVKSRPAC